MKPLDQVTKADINKMPIKKLMAFFKTLEAPTIEELNGEYAAAYTKQVSILATIIGHIAVYNPFTVGFWRCKCFRPVTAETGRGYNSFYYKGKIKQRFAMHTLIAPSRYDGKPAYQLVYPAYYSACQKLRMVDEIRRVNDGLYLGIGTCGKTDKQRMIPLPFTLSGPVGLYRGDIGRENPDFVLENELPALRQPTSGR